MTSTLHSTSKDGPEAYDVLDLLNIYPFDIEKRVSFGISDFVAEMILRLRRWI
jgi:hypothetical protein